MQISYLFKSPILKLVLLSPHFSYQYQAPGSSKARGIAILLSSTISFYLAASMIDLAGGFLFVKGKIDRHMITLSSQIQFLKSTLGKLKKIQEGEVLIGGDCS